MAKIVSFLNQKGGVGKTTTAVNVASQLHADGDAVLLVDLDPQSSATDWSAAQTDENTFPVIQMGKNLVRDLPRVSHGYDWVIIDGAPQVAELAALAVKASDVVLIPCQPSPFDVWACGDLVDVIKVRQEVTDGKPKAAFVVSMAIKNTRLSTEVKGALSEYELPVFDAGTTRSVVYAETAKNGGSVLDLSPDHQASFEIRKLAKELRGFVNV
ncbi:ParA family partition ATPase [Vibrio cyclitrophicus]|uniref:Chromosome (Plasmid) partitioning protein ParA n=1 Tax=Vibrio sp. 1F_97 TaxID=1652827 RepID=A0A0H3ZTV9_9VIBR|nr:ParA family partition ATPase [Vibrio cyclitrophicus]AKN37304.1 Chromosome (plasmid) partitioning protein ParA [Vibrio sp. 1F_97]OEF28092.1 peptide transporter [Vibrio cyclitrophicus 1F97]